MDELITETLRAPAHNEAIYRSGYSYDYYKRKLGRTREERLEAKKQMKELRDKCLEF